MTSAPHHTTTTSSLEAEFRQLAVSARKSESFVTHFFSSGSGAQNEIKESAEKVLVVLRNSSSLEDLQASKDAVVKPLELACENGSPKLIALSLNILQKLISCDIFGNKKDDCQLVMSILASVEKVNDEGVQLKILQTSLILLQSPIHPTSADSICSLLSLCFRSMIPKGRNSQVMSTAAATVRQAVAIIFSYVDVSKEVERIRNEISIDPEAEDESRESLKACQRLLEDLIALSSGSPARWIKTPSLPRTASLEILDFALLSSPALFMALPEFESSLSLRIIQLLQSQIQDYLDAVANSGGTPQNFYPFKAVLRCIRTLLLLYHESLGTRCRGLVMILLKGAQSSVSMIHRVTICQVIRQLLGDPSLVLFLYTTFDASQNKQTDVLIAMVNVVTDIAESGLEGDIDAYSNGPSAQMDAVSQVYFSREVSFDVDIEPSMPPSLQKTACIVIAMNAVLRCMQSMSVITYHCLGLPAEVGEQATSPRFHKPSLPLEYIDVEVCKGMMAAFWEPILSPVTNILRSCSHEKLEMELLHSVQIFTEAIGKLHMRDPMTACLDSLCRIALSGTEGGGDEIGEDKLVLRSKNVQAMKTIFRIARGLANDLGPAWRMVLEAMYSLDNILMDPKLVRKTGDNDGSVDDLSLSNWSVDMSDVEDLRNVMQELFTSTRNMSSEGVVALLGGLQSVSMHHLPQAEQVSQPKMSALNRMVDVLLANSFRVYDLWGTFLSHVLELVADSKSRIREAAVEALGRAITGTLANLNISDEEESTGGLEHMLLVALEALHNDDQEVDVQVGVLKVLSQVLQRNGERLTDGWTPVFRLLAAVAENNSPEIVPLGCESLQIIYNNFMDKMPLKRIKKCLEVAELYGKQQADINVSLTVISLLWNVGDMLGTRCAEDGQVAKDASGPVKYRDEVEVLFEVIYTALFNISRDTRPEVRNSGARTLFTVATAHGNRLSIRLWKEVLWENLFPLLRYAFHMSVTSSKEEAEAALLGKSKGEQVRLVVHHSRNTEQKQWDETVVVCLAGMTRLIRSHLGIMSQLEGFEDGWSELMVVVESSLAGGRKEVALAAMNLIGGLMGTVSVEIDERMWQRGIRALDVGVVAATSSGCQVPLGARTELVNVIGTLYEGNRLRFDRASSLEVYKWIESFCRNPWSGDDACNPVQPVGMPPVQKTALNVLLKLQPTHDETLWPDYLEAVARLLDPEHAIALMDSQQSNIAGRGNVEGSDTNNDALPPPSLAQYRFALNAAFVERVMGQLTILFEQAPLSARAAAFPGIIDVLGRCMELKFTAYDQTLWRTAANVFLRLVPVGVTAVDAMNRKQEQSKDETTRQHRDRAWVSLSSAISKFLLGSHEQIAPEHGSASVDGVSQDSAGELEEDKKSIPVIPYVPSSKSKRKPRLFSLRSRQDSLPPHTQEEDMLPPMKLDTSDGFSETTANEQRAKEDYELEIQMLDCLTDDILTACGTASQPAIDGLIQIVEHGIKRPKDSKSRGPSDQSNFGLICIRKMYVLCSRGSSIQRRGDKSPVGGDADQILYEEVARVRNHVARCALPRFLKQCHETILEFSEESQYSHQGDRPVERSKLEEIICILEVLATMTLAPGVVDAILPANDPITEYIKLMRTRPDVISRGKERTHLLFLYDSLCSLITCRDGRIREMVRDVMGLAGADLGISLNAGLL